ncbi:MAG: DNA-deoxyinosine glycosylase [Clostridia bacterium]|nr:DNA-deoxyinosine glycosylase [Clostridia bacterium]
MEHLEHPIPPLYDAESRILILGSFPSRASRQAAFFYGHPQNRFWKTVSALLGCDCPMTVEEKAAMLRAHHIALWDTIASCDIELSSDASIQNAAANDLSPILQTADIRAIFCNGAASYNLYCKYLQPVTGIEAVKLPSTSPANAAWSVERLMQSWRVILNYL